MEFVPGLQIQIASHIVRRQTRLQPEYPDFFDSRSRADLIDLV
jgi:hypothetical protein